MLFTSYIELSKKALNDNIQYMKKMAGKDVRYSVVMKANAYGHGIEDFLPLVEDCGVDHISVFSAEEARRVLKIKKPECHIMMMGFVDDDYLEWAIENEISFYVFSKARLDAVVETVKETSKPAKIHIELETGMHRTGFIKEDLPYVLEKLKSSKNIDLEGLCTHYAGSESLANFPRVKDQIKTFEKRCSWFQEQGLKPKYRHVACSSGLINFPEHTYDLVRIGISNYGFWPNNETKMLYLKKNNLEIDPLKRVLTWKSKVLSVNKVAEGEYVSYGTSYLTNRESKIATIPVGYGYGFSRTLSNNGRVLINGKRVPVVGAVNMNMMVVDVTDLADVKVGDEVVLIGKQGELEISVSSFSDMNNSMNYELLTRIPQAIPRREVD